MALGAGESVQFNAEALGLSESAVEWTLGSPAGNISPLGLYSAPAIVATPQTVRVTATSFSRPRTSAHAIIVLMSGSITTLRQAAAARGLLVGSAASADDLAWVPNPLNDPAYAATLAGQYNLLSPENALKWPVVQPAQGAYRFGPADQLIAFAQAHGMKVRGHTLCWYMGNPDWLNSLAATASPLTMAALLKEQIETLVTRYRGQVYAWDVVNEAIGASATGVGVELRDSIWYNQPGIGLPGTGYIEQAFRWAHTADPDALLFYNEYGVEDAGPKFEAMYSMVRDFVSRGVPIHGVGIQMHIDTSGYPTTAGLIQNMQRLAALGLQVHITEMDVRLPVDSTDTPAAEERRRQAQTYARILSACLQVTGCTAFQTWQFSDKYSWIPPYFPGYGSALPFDHQYQPKLAFSALMGSLEGDSPGSN